jgi:hypothetical protein
MDKRALGDRSYRDQPQPSVRGLFNRLTKPLATVVAIVGFVFWAHFGSGTAAFRSEVLVAPGWHEFSARYRIDEFGSDGYFTRAVRNGYNLFYFTHEHGSRFTRKTARDAIHSCAGCHTPKDLAYSFVNSDRFNRSLGKRMSFEERVMRCYAGSMDGFVPTLYDPTVRDIRILARAIAHHLQLSEGARKEGG